MEVSVHPQTGAIIIRAGVRFFEDGKVTKRFKETPETCPRSDDGPSIATREVIVYVSSHQVLALHATLAGDYGGSDRSCETVALLESALARPP